MSVIHKNLTYKDQVWPIVADGGGHTSTLSEAAALTMSTNPSEVSGIANEFYSLSGMISTTDDDPTSAQRSVSAGSCLADVVVVADVVDDDIRSDASISQYDEASPPRRSQRSSDEASSARGARTSENSVPIVDSGIRLVPTTKNQIRLELERVLAENESIRRAIGEEEHTSTEQDESSGASTSQEHIGDERIDSSTSNSSNVGPWNKSKKLSNLIVFSITVSLAFGVILLWKSKGDNMSDPEILRADQMLDALNNATLVDRSLRYDPLSPFSEDQAVTWLLDERAERPGIRRDWLLQRYALLTLWFANHQAFASPQAFIANAEACKTNGVWSCDDKGDIVEIYLPNQSLRGTIPVDIGLLTSLYSLNLKQNAMEGAIPTQIGHLSELQFMFLDHNILNGSIPSELGALSDVVYVHLQHNHLRGTIPTTLAKLSRLENFQCQMNPFLTGSASACEAASKPYVATDCDRVHCLCCVGCVPASTMDDEQSSPPPIHIEN